MALVSAASFNMGDPWSEGDPDEQPVHAVYLGPYSIDTYEVANQHCAAALNFAYAQGGLITIISGMVYQAGSGTSFPYCDTTIASPYSGITWSGGTFGVVAGREDHPMVQVSWYGSVAYAN